MESVNNVFFWYILRDIVNLLLPTSIASDEDNVPSLCCAPRLARIDRGACLAGDEKMPSAGSRPNSSRTPVSRRVMPVLLQVEVNMRSAEVASELNRKTDLPTTPGSKY